MRLRHWVSLGGGGGGRGGGAVEWSMHAQIQIFFVTEGGGGGGGGVQAHRRENSFDFFYVCFGVFSPNFPGMRGGVNYLRGGGGGGPNANFYRI